MGSSKTAGLHVARAATVRSIVCALVFVAAFQPTSADAVAVPPAVPRARCGPGSIREPSIQGRVPQAVYASKKGLRCNIEVVGRAGPAIGGFRTHRYVDRHGHECAFFDTSPLLPSDRAALLGPQASGTFAVDMSRPSKPVITASLDSPAMRSPHESLSLHVGRGLLAANMGTIATLPGFVDVYDVKQDCRHPSLLGTLPTGILGHEGSFSPDGQTFWVTSPSGWFAGTNFGGIAAIDVSEPGTPTLLWTTQEYTPHGLNLSPDGKTLYFGDMSTDPGLTVLDVSDIQARKPSPMVRLVSHLAWETVSIPQTDIPVTIRGHRYLIDIDEFTRNSLRIYLTGGSFSDPKDMVGAARIIDIANPRRPKVVSNIRLEVHAPKARGGPQADDPGASTSAGYSGHYCAVPRTTEPTIVACSFILSGLRVFDVRDPKRPKEIAYFNPPSTSGQTYGAYSAPAFAPERKEIWYTDGNHGFYAVRVTNGAWPS